MDKTAEELTSGKDFTGAVECDGSGFLHWWSDGTDVVREGRCPGCPNCAELRRREAEADRLAYQATPDGPAVLPRALAVALYVVSALLLAAAVIVLVIVL